MAKQPTTAAELADALAQAASRKQTIELGGSFSKRLGGGPIGKPQIVLSTAKLNRVLAYEPRDLTISVGAGMTYAELCRTLEPNRQMVPLDPPFAATATIGGILGANASGPRRRLYGTGRDLVIGMTFATMEGKLVESGGMVVKNVAGLDMAKLLIGSWGTLAAMTSVNFKLLPMPLLESTVVFPVDSPAMACAIRDRIIRSVLQPCSIDFINTNAASFLATGGPVLAVEFGGNQAVIERSVREALELASGEALSPGQGPIFWAKVRDLTASFLAAKAAGAIVRISTTLSDLRLALESLEVPVIARAGSGVIYAYFDTVHQAINWMNANANWPMSIEYAPSKARESHTLWPSPGGDLAIMKRLKTMFDPENLLNRGRYYRHF